MVYIVFGAAGAEGLGNIPIDEQFWRLENGSQIVDTVRQMGGSHEAFPVDEDDCAEYWQRVLHINTLDVVAG